MATRNIVPRATGEGSIGTSAKTWSAVYANDIAVTNGVSASTFTGNLTGTASGNLALSGGTLTGVVNGVTPPNGDNSKKLATTEFVTAKAGNYLPLSGGTVTGDLSVSGAIYSSDPASGENSGQVPTTAWVQKLLADALKKAKLDAHPVGSYYWSNDSTSPATLFGGTWEALPPGYTLIAQGSGSDSFGSFTYEAGQKYGERKHQLTTDELPGHSHTVYVGGYNGWPTGSPSLQLFVNNFANFLNDRGKKYTGPIYKDSVESTGGNQPHNTLPPSIACYGWRRTA